MKKILYIVLSFLLCLPNLHAEMQFLGGSSGSTSASTTYLDDVPVYLGTDNDVEHVFDTNTSGDQLYVTRFLESNASSQIPVWLVGDASLTDAVISTTWDNVSDPTFGVYSDDATGYIAMSHNGTNAILATATASGIIFRVNSVNSMRVSSTTVTHSVRTVNTVLAFSVADDGAGTSPSGTITPTTGYVEGTCNDANGCTAVVSETSAAEGQYFTFVNVGTNAITLADTAGVTEISGSFAMGQYDSISFVYDGTQWVETGRSNN